MYYDTFNYMYQFQIRGVFCLWDDGVVLTLVKNDNINEVL